MKPIDDLLHHVLPFAPDCPEPTAIYHLRQAAIAFCERTRIWRHAATVVATSPVVVVAPEHAQVYEIEEAWIGGERLERRPVKELLDWPNESPGVPRWIAESGDDAVLLVPFDAGTPGELRLSVYLKPSNEATLLPPVLVDAHARTIADGALANLLMVPNQPFSNPTLAAGFGMRFDAQANRHFAANVRGRQRAAPRAQPHWF